MSIFDKGFVTILAVSALLILLAVPLVLRKVPRNPIYGFRTRATMTDDEVWFSANAHFGRGLIIASLCAIGVALGIYLFRPFPAEVFLPLSIVIMVVPGLVAALATLRHVGSRGLSSKGGAGR